MRVTARMAIDRFIRDVHANERRIFRLQQQVSSGVRLQRPSDDPVSTARAMRFTSERAQIDRFLANAREASDWLEATDGALNEAQQVLMRARELAVYGASDTLSAAERRALAEEVQVLFDHLLQVANTSYKGRYLFAGTKTTTAPFVQDPTDPDGVRYDGDQGTIAHPLGPGENVSVNVTGDVVLKPALGVLVRLRDNLNAGDAAAISSQSLAELDQQLDALLATRSQVGARMQRAELATRRLEDLSVQVETLLSETRDADIAEVLMRLSSAEVSLRAALAVGARLIQPTLADYLT